MFSTTKSKCLTIKVTYNSMTCQNLCIFMWYLIYVVFECLGKDIFLMEKIPLHVVHSRCRENIE